MQKNWKIKNFTSLIDNMNVNYYKDFLTQEKADKYYKLFENKLTYNSELDSKVTLPSGEFYIKRKQVAYGDPSVIYHFAGVSSIARSWDDKNDPICIVLKKLKRKVELFTKQTFNYVLINRYADGDDSIGYHRDKEEELDKYSSIVGVTFGAERDFSFKPDKFIPKKLPDKIDIILHHGSIISMNYPTNQYWKHSVPKRAKIRDSRINLTFRKIKKSE